MKSFNEKKPDIILCYGYPAISFVKNIDCIKVGWCEYKLIYSTSSLFYNRNFFQFLKKLIILIKQYNFGKKMIKEFNKLDYRFLHSKDFADAFVKAGVSSCEHLLPPIHDAREIF